MPLLSLVPLGELAFLVIVFAAVLAVILATTNPNMSHPKRVAIVVAAVTVIVVVLVLAWEWFMRSFNEWVF